MSTTCKVGDIVCNLLSKLPDDHLLRALQREDHETREENEGADFARITQNFATLPNLYHEQYDHRLLLARWGC